MATQERQQTLKKAERLQIFNALYDVVEVGVSLTAGFLSGSAALIGWGLDSTIEVISATTLWWRLHGEVEGIPEEEVTRREKITLYVIAVSFLIISCFITYDSVTKLLSEETASWSTLGIVILCVSLIVNPLLIYYKRKYGNELDNDELIADSKDTFICLYQTVAVLAGLLAARYFGWWWADPAAALLIVPYALKEGWEAFQKGRSKTD